MKKLLFLSIFILISTLACKKESKNKSTSTSHEALTLVANNTTFNTFATFSNEEELQLKMAELSDLTNEDRLAWESTIPGFKSMRAAFKELTDAETDIANQIENDPNMDENTHSPLATIYANAIVTKTEDGGSFYDKNIAYECYSWIANIDGMFAVGQTLYQMTETQLKYKESSDFNADIEALKSATSSDPASGITVEEIGISANLHLNKSRIIVGGLHSFNRSCCNNNNRNRVITYQNFTQKQSSLNGYDAVITEYIAKTRSLVRRIRGAWYDNKNASHRIDIQAGGGAFTDDWNQIANTKNLSYNAMSQNNNWYYINDNVLELWIVPNNVHNSAYIGRSKKVLWTSDADNSKGCPDLTASNVNGFVQSNNTTSCNTWK